MPVKIESYSRFIRYAVVGLVHNSAAYCIFLILSEIGVHPVLASGLCYCLSLAAAYLGNRYWAFQGKASHGADIPRFLTAYGIGLVFAVACMAVLLIWFSPPVAQLLTILLTALAVYGCLLAFRFGQVGERRADRA